MRFDFEPARTFKDDARRKFLAAFDARHPGDRRTFWITTAARFLAAAAAIVAIVMSGATVYADAANVPAWSPLYPFKRLGENIQIAVAPPSEGASLQASFAARRVEEIGDLQNREPTSTMIGKLAGDANDAVDASISDAAKAGLKGEELTALCNKLLSTLVPSSTASTTAPGRLYGNLHALDEFVRRCDQTQTVSNGAGHAAVEGGGGQGTATSGLPTKEMPETPTTVNHPPFVQATSTAPTAPTGTLPSQTPGRSFETETSPGAAVSSSAVTPNVPELETRIREYLRLHLPASDSLDLTTTTGRAIQSAVMELNGGNIQTSGGSGSKGGGGDNGNSGRSGARD